MNFGRKIYVEKNKKALFEYNHLYEYHFCKQSLFLLAVV